jgi:hypothetical protein
VLHAYKKQTVRKARVSVRASRRGVRTPPPKPAACCSLSVILKVNNIIFVFSESHCRARQRLMVEFGSEVIWSPHRWPHLEPLFAPSSRAYGSDG